MTPISTTFCHRVATVPFALIFIVGVATQAQAGPKIDALLADGKFREAEETLSQHLSASPNDDVARFQLGTVQLFRAVEQLAQDGLRYGVLSNALAVPFVRIGGFGDRRDEPEPVTYQDIRAMIGRFQTGVAAAEKTLAAVESDELDWRLDFSQVAFDLDGDGDRKPAEQLDSLFRMVAGVRRPQRRQPVEAVPEPIVVDFDAADVYWLRGYCHVLQALADMTLAYDHDRLFELTAHAFFANPQTDYVRKQDGRIKHSQNISRQFWGDWEGIADLIAAIHLMDFKLIEPRRMGSGRDHLLEVIELSRQSWKLIAQETDNRNEWIPGSGQKSVIPRLQAGPDQIDAWMEFLDEAEELLSGDKLMPFWRSGFTEGVNLRLMFEDPRDFDLLLWIQGTAALPYLEEGEQTDPRFWRELQRTFRGQFLGFALWTN